jgi:fatty-acyl-CoA synthase
VLANMEKQGFNVTHVYGLTETYGPAVICAWKDEWNELGVDGRAARKARQGVPYHMLEDLCDGPGNHGAGPAGCRDHGRGHVPGNNVMKGYLKNTDATDEALAGGWFHSGDLGVMHPDGYIQLKDRSKDIIISGGENISSIEVEDCLYRIPAVEEAAVVARPDDKWGETPCAFVTLRTGARPRSRKSSISAGATWPTSSARRRGLRRAAEDVHRQDPEVQAAAA